MNLNRPARRITLLCGCLGLFVGFQIPLLVGVSIPDYDEAIHLNVAESIHASGLPMRRTGALLLDHTPLYVYVLGAAYSVFGTDPLGYRLLGAAFAAGAVWIAFAIGFRVSGPTAGAIAAAILALSPYFQRYGVAIRPEAPLCFFIVLSMYLVARAERNAKHGGALLLGAGVAAAAAVMTKEIGLAFWAVGTVYCGLVGTNKRERVRFGAAFGLWAPLCLGAWFLCAHSLEALQFEHELQRWIGAWGHVRSLEPRAQISTIDGLNTLLKDVVGRPLLILVGVAGVAAWIDRARRRPPRFTLLPAGYAACVVGASLVMSLKEPRHGIGLVPALALVVALLVDTAWIARWIDARPMRRIAAGSALLVTFWALSPIRLPPPVDYDGWLERAYAAPLLSQDRNLKPLRAVGGYLRLRTRPGEAIAVARRGPTVAFYARRPYRLLYVYDLATNLETLSGVRFVVLDRTEFWRQSEAETRQLLEHLQRQFAAVEHPDWQPKELTLYERKAD